jgi:hypothetical protein
LKGGAFDVIFNTTSTHEIDANHDEVKVTQSVLATQTLEHGRRTKSPALEKHQGRGTPSSKS